MSSAYDNLSDEQAKYLQFLVRYHVDLDDRSKAQWCEQNSIYVSTAKSWEKSALFQSAYRRAIQEEFTSPERLNIWLNKIERAAFEDGAVQVSLVNKLLEWVEKIRPTTPLDEQTASISDLSDDDLAQLIFDAAELRGWEVTVDRHDEP